MSSELQAKRRKKKKADLPALSSGAPRPKKHKVNPLKSRVRDLERLLGREGGRGLPADVRVERERELAACRRELAAEQGAIKRQDMIRKYHMVRFFDRRKAERRLKKVTKQLEAAAGSDERERLSVEKHVAEVELNYTMYYPLAKPYVALYPKNDKDKDKDVEYFANGDETAHRKRGDQVMWEEVERAMEQGSLSTLRESSGPAAASSSQSATRRRPGEKTQAPKGRGHRPLAHEEEPVVDKDDGNDSDGGFFE